MENEENRTQEQESFGAEDYINSLNEIRENTVSKDEYNRILEDNRKLADALAKGDYGNEGDKVEPVNLDELRKSLFSPDSQRKTNLQYFTEVLTLRNAVIEQGGKDPFLPYNREYVANEQDVADADRIASVLQECIDYAEGDPQVFNVELQRRCGQRKR